MAKHKTSTRVPAVIIIFRMMSAREMFRLCILREIFRQKVFRKSIAASAQI